MALYRHAVDLLRAEGYQQRSMRMFRRAGVSGATAPDTPSTAARTTA